MTLKPYQAARKQTQLKSFASARGASVVILGLSAWAVQAQEGVLKDVSGISSNSDTGKRLSNGLVLFPSVKLSVGRDDNIRATPNDPISATVTTLAPSLRAEAQNSSGDYSLLYAGAYTRYSGYKQDKTDNHNLVATGDHTLSIRSRVNWSLGFQDAVDPRADAVSASAEPDQWRGLNLNARYSYGAKQAKGRIETVYSFSNKRYQNNLATTANSDVDTHQVGALYYWRVMPKTQLVAEARLGSSSYRVNTSNDNTDTRLLAGVTWEATAKTSGTVEAFQNKRFDAPGKADASGATYEASVEWKPLSYSVFTLAASRQAQDALSAGDYEQATNLSLAWAHQWNATLSSRVGLSGAPTRYVNNPRKDDTLTTSVGLGYRVGRHYTLGLDLMHTQRDSTLAGFNYKRNTLLVSLNAAL